jgi:hypothetical protein
MPRKYEFPKLGLEIDGRQLPAGKAGILFQKDPYPGGHNYSASIFHKGLNILFYYLPIAKSRDISEDEARRFFLTLGLGIGHPKKIDYFINRVKEIDFDGEQIKFSGVCSEVIR